MDRTSSTDANRRLEGRAQRIARDSPSTATGTSRHSVASVNALNEAQTSDLPVVVAKVSAPTALDSAGNPVESKLSADGSVVTLQVDHKDESWSSRSPPIRRTRSSTSAGRSVGDPNSDRRPV